MTTLAQILAGGQTGQANPVIQIGPPDRAPSLEAARRQWEMAQQMQAEDPWTFLGSLAQQWAAGRSLSQAREAEEAKRQRTQAALGNILGTVSEGGGRQALAAALAQNPAIMQAEGAPALMNLALALAKEPDPLETWETVHDPYGRGGVGQRSTLTGKITGYQAPLDADTPSPFTLSPGQVRYDAAGNIVAEGPEEPAGPYETWHDQTTGELHVVREGSPEEVAAVEAGLIPGKPQRQTERPEKPAELRKEFSRESQTFIDTQDAIRRVSSSLDRETAAGDMAAIFNYMKVLDPDSVVRESEYATAENARAWTDGMRNLYNKAIDGVRLTPEQREDFRQTAAQLYLGQAEQQARKRQQYTGIAEGYGFDPRTVLVDYLDQDLYDRLQPPTAPSAPATPPAAPEAPVQAGMAPTGAPAPAERPPVGELQSKYDQMDSDALIALGGDDAAIAAMTPEEFQQYLAALARIGQ